MTGVEYLVAKGEAVEERGFRLMGPEIWARLWERPVLRTSRVCLGAMGEERDDQVPETGNNGRSGHVSVWSVWSDVSKGPRAAATSDEALVVSERCGSGWATGGLDEGSRGSSRPPGGAMVVVFIR